jgi:hypothetical protein
VEQGWAHRRNSRRSRASLDTALAAGDEENQAQHLGGGLTGESRAWRWPPPARRCGDVCGLCGRFRSWGKWLLVEWQRELAGAGKVRRFVSGEASAMAVGGLPRSFR